AETVWMNFLTHNFLQSVCLSSAISNGTQDQDLFLFTFVFGLRLAALRRFLLSRRFRSRFRFRRRTLGSRSRCCATTLPAFALRELGCLSRRRLGFGFLLNPLFV